MTDPKTLVAQAEAMEEFADQSFHWMNGQVKDAARAKAKVYRTLAAAQLGQGEREAFEKWMVEKAKCVVGSYDPYPAGIERQNWLTWQGAWQVARTQPPAQPEGPFVRFCEMAESNGCVTWFVYLARTPDASIFDCHQVYASTIKGRAEYERDALMHFLGQAERPDILAYDTDPAPQAPGADKGAMELLREARKQVVALKMALGEASATVMQIGAKYCSHPGQPHAFAEELARYDALLNPEKE